MKSKALVIINILFHSDDFSSVATLSQEAFSALCDDRPRALASVGLRVCLERYNLLELVGCSQVSHFELLNSVAREWENSIHHLVYAFYNDVVMLPKIWPLYNNFLIQLTRYFNIQDLILRRLDIILIYK